MERGSESSLLKDLRTSTYHSLVTDTLAPNSLKKNSSMMLVAEIVAHNTHLWEWGLVATSLNLEVTRRHLSLSFLSLKVVVGFTWFAKEVKEIWTYEWSSWDYLYLELARVEKLKCRSWQRGAVNPGGKKSLYNSYRISFGGVSCDIWRGFAVNMK